MVVPGGQVRALAVESPNIGTAPGAPTLSAHCFSVPDFGGHWSGIRRHLARCILALAIARKGFNSAPPPKTSQAGHMPTALLNHHAFT